MHPKNHQITDYTYSLPEDKIAAFPLQDREDARLLIFKDDLIQEEQFKNISAHLPENSLLIFNNSKVIPARILFQKSTGGIIEIFCLEPASAIKDYSVVMNVTQQSTWKVLIGGASKWKEGPLKKFLIVEGNTCTLEVVLVEKLSNAYIVEFSWTPAHLSFASVIESAGLTPLPPYIKRVSEASDKERYQTIYAKNKGSVAAPTAGLHFTGNIFNSFADKNIVSGYVTLHVGAGTFKPVQAERMSEHEMHTEWIEINSESLQLLIEHIDQPVIAVGTTSVRTLESIYWMGVKTIMNFDIKNTDLTIDQWEVYDSELSTASFTAREALISLQQWMEQQRLAKLITATQILIAPGYKFKLTKALVTNFHQPQSTLLLLVAAAVSKKWETIYEYALKNDFRFLSYGDGSLLYVLEENR
jgi:S-adenosylmethionine:tRNA ribosyltransferase-isomerase